MVLTVGSAQRSLTMASFYGVPDKNLSERSCKTYVSVKHLRDAGICMIDVKDIDSVIAMVPDNSYGITCHDSSKVDHWFLMEKLGMKLLTMDAMDDLSSQ